DEPGVAVVELVAVLGLVDAAAHPPVSAAPTPAPSTARSSRRSSVLGVEAIFRFRATPMPFEPPGVARRTLRQTLRVSSSGGIAVFRPVRGPRRHAREKAPDVAAVFAIGSRSFRRRTRKGRIVTSAIDAQDRK